MAGRLRVVPDGDALSRVAAREFLMVGEESIRATGRFTVALAGGNTPRATYERIPAMDSLDWARVYFFWGDERPVPPDHPDSNYRMAKEALLARISIPESNVLPIPAASDDPHRAAAEYESRLRKFFELNPGERPRFDLVLLGMGADGHVASLFPETDALETTDKLVAAAWVAKLGTWRVTLTLPVLNQAANTIVLVSGREKSGALRRVIEGPRETPPLPAERLQPESGTLLWLADREAAPWASD
jgi:6-phosphogluconolactonase